MLAELTRGIDGDAIISVQCDTETDAFSWMNSTAPRYERGAGRKGFTVVSRDMAYMSDGVGGTRRVTLKIIDIGCSTVFGRIVE